VGARGPYLPRFPAPGLHPHPLEGYFGMSSRLGDCKAREAR
jgi:hypothetical protein